MASRSLAPLVAVLVAAALLPASAAAADQSFIGSFSKVDEVGSTVPGNGDLNPYGIVNVTKSTGSLVAGDILISNFNNASTGPEEGNEQGRGTTLVEVSRSGGKPKLFAEIKAEEVPNCTGGVGLTTALTILPGGFVVVGSLPTEDGTAKTAKAGCLIVLNSDGHPVDTISGGPINGPWDMTSVVSVQNRQGGNSQGGNSQGGNSQGEDGQGQSATLFVTNVLNGTVAANGATVDEGTVVRIRLRLGPGAPKVTAMDVIGEGFPERTDPSALVVGPTGVSLAINGTLYVADTDKSRIAAIPNALSRTTPLGGAGNTVVEEGFLNAPLGMTLAPNGDIVTANGGNGNLVETTPAGAEFPPVDTGAGAGGLFGLTVAPRATGVYFVNDTENTLDLLH
jgi:hypothetical protein